MPQPSQAFHPTSSRIAQSVLFCLVFIAWAGFAVFAFRTHPPRAGVEAWPAYVITFGVPLGMLILCVVGLLSSLATLTVDEDGVRIEGPLGRRTARWGDVVGYDQVGTQQSGVVLRLRDGGKVTVSYGGYREGSPRPAVDARLHSMLGFGVEGREFRMRGAKLVTAVLVGMLLFTAAASTTIRGNGKGVFMLNLVVLALTTIPLSAYFLTDRVMLQNGVLTKASIFGTRQIVLAEVQKAELKLVSTKGGPQEQLLLKGPRTVRLSANREGYPMLRDAILAELPPAVRPQPLA